MQRTRRAAARTAGLLLAALTASTAPLLVPGPATAAGSEVASAVRPAQTKADRHEQRLQQIINAKRTARGLRPLRLDRCTDRIAERWGRHLARTGSFEHQSLTPLLRDCDARWAGETLAYGRVRPARMVSMWMRSDGHRAILLSRQATHVGIGAARDSRGWVVAADFTRL